MTPASEKDPLLKRLRRLVFGARLQLFWEQYAPVFAIAMAGIGIFMAASFSGLWERIGDPWRLAGLIAAIYFTVKAAIVAKQLRRPSLSDARRRVENDSGAPHRPLDTLDDAPALGSPAWTDHYAGAYSAAQTLKRPRLRAVLQPIDPYYVRFGLPVVIVLALLIGAGDSMERLRRSLSPAWQSGISAGDVQFEAWVNPPEYTGRPPIYFKDKRKIDVPAGSELVARISGAKDATRLKLKTNKRARYLPLERLGPKSFEARSVIKVDTVARWRVGTKEQSWSLTAVPDRAPTLSIDTEPRADKRDRLAFTYSFEDDYGVEELKLGMRLLTEDEEAAAEFVTVNVPLSGSSVRKAEFTNAALDLTRHKWAGKKVSAMLIAVDGLGQQTRTQDVYFTVPDRIFIEPLAKAVMEHRSLMLSGTDAYVAPKPLTRQEARNRPYFDTFDPRNRLDRAPAEVQRTALLIEATTDLPEDYFHDPAVYLGLKNVLSRLRYADEQADLQGIPEDLWGIAIRAEFGVLGTALEEMREAAAALREGITRRAPQREIDTLFERYNTAVDRYMEELRRKAVEDGNMAEGGGSGETMGSTDEIQELLDAIEEANRIGDTEGARRALARLAELLENMQIQLAQGGGGNGNGEPMEGEMTEEMRESLEDLADLLGEQRELKDETERAENQGPQDGGPTGDGQSNPEEGEDGEMGSSSEGPSETELAERQGALEDALRALREGLPEESRSGGSGNAESESDEGGGGEDDSRDPDESLADAQDAMERSERALRGGELEDAARAQADAIEALTEAGENLAEIANQQANRNGNQQAGSNDNTDPLGRENSGRNDDTSEADLEQRDNAQRSRELLEELRRRAAEQEREESERDYLDRLLKRF